MVFINFDLLNPSYQMDRRTVYHVLLICNLSATKINKDNIFVSKAAKSNKSPVHFGVQRALIESVRQRR